MLSIHDLTVSYGTKNVIRNLSLELEDGKIHGIVGPNGEGKTTLLNSIYQLHKPNSGSILWSGDIISPMNTAYLPSELYFYPLITGLEYLQLFQQSKDSMIIIQLNKLMNLPLDSFIEDYSSGMKKRLAIMAILSLNCSLFLLDEPYNGLDLEGSYVLTNLLKVITSEGGTILLTSHILESLTGLCDDISYLRSGTVMKKFMKDEMHLISKEIFGAIDVVLRDEVMDVFRQRN